jgi:hypothetical protein
VVTDSGYASWENVIAMNAAGVSFIGSITDRTAQAEVRFKRRGIDTALVGHKQERAYEKKADGDFEVSRCVEL